jgi:AraC-like DNA-binding protein
MLNASIRGPQLPRRKARRRRNDADRRTENSSPVQFPVSEAAPKDNPVDHLSTLSAQVRLGIARLLTEGTCTHPCVAAALGLHPRTLQRRLRKEGASFESIKDDVRRDVALRYLQQPSIPLMRVAHILGFSESSVLSRNCHRWFAASPRELRKRLPLT